MVITMLLRRLKLNYFGRFQNKEIELKPGINLIYGENEAGKSTVHTFIRGMFFGIDRMRGRGAATKEDIYHRYLPWEYPGAYSGSLELELENRVYQLRRSFHANDKSFSIIDLATGREVKLEGGSICDLIPGLTETTYKNTISIEQLKAFTDTELAAQVQNYIANLSLAKSQEVDVAKAVWLLTEQRKLHDTSQTLEEMKRIQVIIDASLKNEEKLDQLAFQLRELEEKEHRLKTRKKTLDTANNQEEQQRILQLPAIIEKYHSFQRISAQLQQLEYQKEVLKNKLAQIEVSESSSGELKDDIKRLEQNQRKRIDLEHSELELQLKKEEFYKGLRKKQIICLSPFVLLSLLFLIGLGSRILSIILITATISLGIVIYFIMGRFMERKGLKFRQKEEEYYEQRQELEEDIRRLLLKYQINQPEELFVKQEKNLMNHISIEHATQQKGELEQRIQELEDDRDVLYEAIMKYIQYFLQEDELNNDSIQRLQDEIARRRQESASKTKENDTELEECRLRMEKLRWEISSLEENEEQLLKNKDLYEELKKKYLEDNLELEAIKLALTTIKELASDIHDSFGQQLNKTVSEIIYEVTKDKYKDLKIDEKLNIKVGWNGSYVLLDKLSAGTIDQIYLALRLAVADLLIGRDQAPFIFDDSFALYDDSRLKAALLSLSKRKQIILFTCHKREEALLQELGMTYHLVDLSK
jgi:hypothetical protein